MWISGSFIAMRAAEDRAVVLEVARRGIVPPATSRTPPIAMSIAAASTSTPEEPTACRIRPGFGSPPNAAVFTSGESATAFATTRASCSEAAPAMSTSITCVTPSPSAISWSASDAPTSAIAPDSCSHAGVPGVTAATVGRRAAREQEHGVVRAGAAVDGQRVEPLLQLLVRQTLQVPVRDAARRSSRTRASSPGWARSCRRPSRTRPRGTRPASAVACLSTVSVVMIARAKSGPPADVSAPARIGSPRATAPRARARR